MEIRTAWRPVLAGLCPSLTWCSPGLLFVGPTQGPTLPKVGLTRWLSGQLRSLLETLSHTEPFPKCHPHIAVYLLISCSYSGEEKSLKYFYSLRISYMYFPQLHFSLSLNSSQGLPRPLYPPTHVLFLKKICIFKQINI